MAPPLELAVLEVNSTLLRFGDALAFNIPPPWLCGDVPFALPSLMVNPSKTVALVKFNVEG